MKKLRQMDCESLMVAISAQNTTAKKYREAKLECFKLFRLILIDMEREMTSSGKAEFSTSRQMALVAAELLLDNEIGGME